MERFARKREGTRSKTITARLDPDSYKRFKEHCNSLGLTVSEAVALLVEKEIRGEDREPTTKTIHSEHKEIQLYTSSSSPRPTPPRRRSGGRRRFTYAPYVVKGKAPCPICETWISRGNLARHMDQHDTNTEEAYKANMEKVRAMVATARGES